MLDQSGAAAALNVLRPGISEHTLFGRWYTEVTEIITDLEARYPEELVTEARKSREALTERVVVNYMLAMYERATADYEAYANYMMAYNDAVGEYKTHLARQKQGRGTVYRSI